ncbi:PREDICTED: acyl-coenzyme A thioesterase 1-like [Cyprinodon variegatus]|uniref:acyl-coenzyme A thioesterase 1-like n=1 Tax=Cyprinodon variegatus TaxID=28743 RepID=UPI0007429CBB|nr:PREDICTED: acyl-coenzyme A thioesterase 1-like [Cyprinodon variegatus]
MCFVLISESMSAQVRLRLLPSVRCLFDEPIQVKVAGLRSKQVVTMRASSTDERGLVFNSSASYRADDRGEIDLKASSKGVGVISQSKGCDIALSLAAFVQGIAAVVWINGCSSNVAIPLYYKNRQILSPLMFNLSKVIPTESGAKLVKYVLEDPLAEENQGSVIPIERADGHFLFVASEDDLNWDTLHWLLRSPVVWGGEPKAHAAAELHLWKKMQDFLLAHLSCSAAHTQSKL